MKNDKKEERGEMYVRWFIALAMSWFALQIEEDISSYHRARGEISEIHLIGNLDYLNAFLASYLATVAVVGLIQKYLKKRQNNKE